MSIRPIEVPKWGLTMEEGTLSRWLIEEGQSFSKGDELCEIETSKIANALEASFDGVLRRILVHPGITLPVGALLAVAAPADMDDAAIDGWLAERQGTAPETPVAAPTAVAAVPVVAPQLASQAGVCEPSQISQPLTAGVPAELRGETPHSVPATPHALRLAQRESIDLSRIAGSGRDGRVSVADVAQAVQAAGGQLVLHNPSPTAVQRGDDSGVAATPIARRLARSRGIDLRDCRATGSGDRVCRADVEAVIAGGGQPIAASLSPVVQEQGTTEQPLSSMRRTIATRLQASKQEAPHYRVCMDMDLEAMLALKDTLNSAVPELKVSVNDLMIKATAHALMAVPQLNVQYDPQRQVVTRFAAADIAVAVAIEGGLITPIIPAANRKSLAEISSMMRDLATRAQAGTLKASEFQGGSFSISNLGMYGVSQFDAIINPPQVAILALGTAEQRVVVWGGEMCVRRQLTASLSSDHRVVDGALAATFLGELKRLVETPALLMV